MIGVNEASLKIVETDASGAAIGAGSNDTTIFRSSGIVVVDAIDAVSSEVGATKGGSRMRGGNKEGGESTKAEGSNIGLKF